MSPIEMNVKQPSKIPILKSSLRSPLLNKGLEELHANFESPKSKKLIPKSKTSSSIPSTPNSLVSNTKNKMQISPSIQFSSIKKLRINERLNMENKSPTFKLNQDEETENAMIDKNLEEMKELIQRISFDNLHINKSPKLHSNRSSITNSSTNSPVTKIGCSNTRSRLNLSFSPPISSPNFLAQQTKTSNLSSGKNNKNCTTVANKTPLLTRATKKTSSIPSPASGFMTCSPLSNSTHSPASSVIILRNKPVPRRRSETVLNHKIDSKTERASLKSLANDDEYVTFDQTEYTSLLSEITELKSQLLELQQCLMQEQQCHYSDEIMEEFNDASKSPLLSDSLNRINNISQSSSFLENDYIRDDNGFLHQTIRPDGENNRLPAVAAASSDRTTSFVNGNYLTTASSYQALTIPSLYDSGLDNDQSNVTISTQPTSDQQPIYLDACSQTDSIYEITPLFHKALCLDVPICEIKQSCLAQSNDAQENCNLGNYDSSTYEIRKGPIEQSKRRPLLSDNTFLHQHHQMLTTPM